MNQGSQYNQNCFSGLLGCMVPIIKRIRLNKPESEWEVTYDQIRDKKFIASGSQGTVFKAKLNNRTIALKKVLNSKEISDTHKLKDLNHRNIAKVIGICSQPPCVLIEFCSNGTLADMLKLQRNKIHPSTCWEFLTQIASGMKYLHFHHITHRDLKPANILITEDNRIKISDFGTCREFMDNSIQMTFAGTCAYMAPELIKNYKCSEKIDIWSYGVIVWEMLSGERPYAGVENARIMFGVCFSKLNLPIAAVCPIGFKNILFKCFNEAPMYRPSFIGILSLLNEPSCLDFYTNTTLEEFNALKEKWSLDLSDTFKTMNTLSIPAEVNNSETDELILRARRELENANILRQKYQEKFDEIVKLVKQFNNGSRPMSDFINVLNDDTKITKHDDKENILDSLLKLKDASPTTFDP